MENIILPITESCNQRCLFCSAIGRNSEIDWETICRNIDEAEKLVVISGGEPTMDSRLFRVIDYIKNRGLVIELQSNGINFYYFSLAKELANKKISLFNINLPAHVENLHNTITQTQNIYYKKLAGIKNLIILNQNVRITHIINSLNYPYLEEFVVFVSKELPQIKYLQFSFVKAMGNVKFNKKIIPAYSMVQLFLQKAFKKCNEFDIDFAFDHIPICFFPEFKEHNVDYQKIKNNEEMIFSTKEKVKLTQCGNCRLNNCCSGVRIDHFDYFADDDMVKPIQ